MKIEIGNGLNTYGTVETTPQGLLITASDADLRSRIVNILRNTRTPGQSDSALLESLLKQLTGRLWARVVHPK